MAADNSFDIVSDVDLMEASNAVQQALKEIRQRFDFKGERERHRPRQGDAHADVGRRIEAQVGDRHPAGKLVKRGVSLKALDYGKVEEAAKGDGPPGRHDPEGDPHGEGQGDREVHQGTGVRVQAQIQEDQVRVTGKKRTTCKPSSRP